MLLVLCSSHTNYFLSASDKTVVMLGCTLSTRVLGTNTLFFIRYAGSIAVYEWGRVLKVLTF